MPAIGLGSAGVRAQSPLRIYVAFAEHYLSVTSRSRDLLSHVMSNFSPMLLLQPLGSEIAQFSIDEVEGAFTIAEEEWPRHQRYDHLHQAIRALHHAIIKRFIDTRRDLLWIHAAVIAFAGRALVIAAPTGEGKSTLVGELLEWGCTYLSDEVAAIDPKRRAVLPFPVSPFKRIATHEALPADRLHEIPKIPIRLVMGSVAASPVPLAKLYILRRARNSTATRVVCSPGVAVLEMSLNSFHAEASRAEEIGRLCELATHVEVAYLDYVDATEAAKHIVATNSSGLA
jgi:hypothetical protein